MSKFKTNKLIPRVTAIYAEETVNLNVQDINSNLDIKQAVYNKGEIETIPHLTLVRGYVRKGIFHIEQWMYSHNAITQCIAYN